MCFLPIPLLGPRLEPANRVPATFAGGKTDTSVHSAIAADAVGRLAVTVSREVGLDWIECIECTRVWIGVHGGCRGDGYL